MILLAQPVFSADELPVITDVHETNDAQGIFHDIQKLDAKTTLVIFDIDNTLIAHDSFLGSEQWFEWQRKLHKNPGYDKGELFGNNPDLFLTFSNFVTPYQPMHSVDENWYWIVGDLQFNGYSVMIETSRAPNTRDGTEQQLRANGFDFSVTAPVQKKSQKEDPLKFTGFEITSLDLEKTPRPRAYEKGIYYTTGQNKGVWLRKLLIDLNQSATYTDIVFIDNDFSNKHHASFEQAFKNKTIRIHRYKYGAENAAMEEFLSSEELQDLAIGEAGEWFSTFGQTKRSYLIPRL